MITLKSIEEQSKGIFKTGSNINGQVSLSANDKPIGFLTVDSDPHAGFPIIAFDSEGVDIQIVGQDIEQVGYKLLDYYKKHRKKR